MKLVTAIVRKEKLNEVITALFAKEIYGITVTKVQGHGGETEEVQNYRGTTEPFVDKAVQAILKAARTGEVGDGKIFVIPVEKVYRIRTGEEDAAAVTPVLVGR
jgi:nitrogen regulatory protein P-II 1